MYQRYGFNKNPFYFEINDPFKTIVGRRKEMKMSLEFIREMKEGKIGIVIITGTHGVGKTHLLFAIGELLRAINEGAIKYLDIE
jgi:chromosomal replication initiation ATPase DnaA